MTKKYSFKNLLTTASAVALLTSANCALAVEYITNTTPAKLSDNTTFTATGGTYAAGDVFKFGANNVTMELDAAIGTTGIEIQINGKTGTAILVKEDITVNKVTDSSTNKATVTFGAAKTLTFSGAGTVYSGVSSVDFNNVAGTLVLSGGGNYAFDLKSTGGNKGEVQVTADGTTLSGAFSSTANTLVETLKINGNTTAATNIVTNGETFLADAKTLTLNASKNLTGGLTLSGATSALVLSGSNTVDAVTATTAGHGSVTVNGDATISRLGASKVGSLVVNNDATVTLGTGGAHLVDAVTTDSNNKGTLLLGHDLSVATIGTITLGLKSTTFNNVDKTLAVSGTRLDTNVDTLATNQGTVSFTNTGTVTVNGTLGTNKALKNVSLAGAAGTVDFGSNINNATTLTFAADATANLTNFGTSLVNVDTSAGAGTGTLNLANTKVLTFTGNIGATNKLKSFALNGSDVTVNGTFASAAVVFGADSTLTLAGALPSTVVTTKTNNTGKIVAQANTTLGGDVGTSTLGLKELNMKGAGLTLAVSGYNVYAPITSTITDELAITVGNSTASTLGEIGSSTYRAKSLTVAAGTSLNITGNVYAKNITLSAANPVTFHKSVNGDGLALATGAVANFANGVDLTMPVTTGNAGAGKLVFQGSHKLTQAVGVTGTKIDSVTFSGGADDTCTLGHDLYTTNGVTFDAGVFNVAANTATTTPALTTAGTITLTGNSTATNSTFNLGKDTLAITGTLGLTGNIVINAVANTDASDYGKFTYSSTLTDSLSTLKLNFNSPVAGDYTILAGTDAEDLAARTTVSNVGLLSTNTVYSAAGKLGVTVTKDTSRFMDQVKTAGAGFSAQSLSQAFLNAYNNTTLEGDAKQLQIALGNSSAATAAETMNRLTPSTKSAASSAAVDMVNSAVNMANMRVDSVAMAAGDENGKLDLGVWAQALAGNAEQKMRKQTAGYKSEVYGGTVGADTMVNESTLLGLSATFSEVELKHKNYKSGDKTKASNLFFSVYGRHDYENNWFGQGVVGFGSGNVKNSENRVVAGGKEVARAKYDTMLFSVEALTGYNYKVSSDVNLTPMAGVRYVKVNDSGYTEKGTTYQNLSVSKKAVDKLYGVFGAKVSSATEMNGTNLTPEAHAFVNYDLLGQKNKTTVTLNGLSGSIDVAQAKAARVNYNLGTSVMAKVESFEYGLGYDAKFADKYTAHQGTLKVKVNL